MFVHDISDIWLEVNVYHLKDNDSATSWFSLSAHTENYLWVIWQGPLSRIHPASKKVHSPRPFEVKPLGVCFSSETGLCGLCSWELHAAAHSGSYEIAEWKPNSRCLEAKLGTRFSRLDNPLSYFLMPEAGCENSVYPSSNPISCCRECPLVFIKGHSFSKGERGLRVCPEAENTETKAFLLRLQSCPPDPAGIGCDGVVLSLSSFLLELQHFAGPVDSLQYTDL